MDEPISLTDLFNFALVMIGGVILPACVIWLAFVVSRQSRWRPLGRYACILEVTFTCEQTGRECINRLIRRTAGKQDQNLPYQILNDRAATGPLRLLVAQPAFERLALPPESGGYAVRTLPTEEREAILEHLRLRHHAV